MLALPEKYRQVLVTDLPRVRAGRLDADGQPRSSSATRWPTPRPASGRCGATPRCDQHGERLSEFLRRVLLRTAPISSPQELAWFLASYAREALARVEERDNFPLC